MEKRDQRAKSGPRAALLRRGWLLLLVLGGVALAAGCVPVPPGSTQGMISGYPRTSPTAWQTGAGCKWGSTTTAGDATKGTVKLQSELCWDANGENLYIAGQNSSCTPGPGWRQSAKQTVYDALNKWSVFETCQFTNGSSAYGVRDRHSWSTSGFSQLFRQGCSTGSDSPITQCNQADPLTWLTNGFEDEWLDTRPPPPPPAPRWVQGSIVPSNDSTAINAAVTVNGKATKNLGGGKFRYDLPLGGTESDTVSIATPPGYAAGWEICVNKSDDSCHNGKKVNPGNSVVVNVNNGDYWDVRWHLTAVGSVSGTRLIGNDLNSKTERDVAAQTVSMDNHVVSNGGGDYSAANVPVGLHTFSVSVPSGVGYTLCAPGVTNCHGNTPTPGSSVQVNVVKGQDVSLYWHYTPPASPACSKPANTYGVSQLRANECLRANQGRISADGKYALIMQGDGNLVIYATATNTPIWASGTDFYQDVNIEAVLQGDGNFVIYAAGAPVWSTNTFDSAPMALVLQVNGDLQLVEATAPYPLLWHSMG